MNKTLKSAVLVSIGTCIINTSFAQDGPEEPLALGFEPSIATNRILSPVQDRRVSVAYMRVQGSGGVPSVYRRISDDRGANWADEEVITEFAARIDPTLACNRTFGDTYYGVQQSGLGTFQEVRRSPNSTGNPLFDDTSSGAEGNVGDRPWLATNDRSIYLSFFNGSNAMIMSRGIINTVEDQPVSWPSNQANKTVTTAPTGFAYIPHGALATGKSTSLGVETVFLMTLEFTSNDPEDPGIVYKVHRSADAGSTWSSSAFPAQRAATATGGYIVLRDRRMAPYHICAYRSVLQPYVYTFYARVENVGSGKSTYLYCRYSYNDGLSWSGEVRIWPKVVSIPPPTGYAPVPPDNSTGFYRVGRVWSCVDDTGRVHVVWVDNRLKADPNNTNRDLWHVYRSTSTDFGQTWSTPQQVSNQPSRGGLGNPFNNENWQPPGDFLSCDADNDRLYVAWADTRDATNNDQTRAFARWLSAAP